MTTPDSITIVRTNRRRLAKIHRGTIAGYDQVKAADLIEKPIADLAALERLLRYLDQRRHCAVVHGAPADPVHRVRQLWRRYPRRFLGVLINNISGLNLLDLRVVQKLAQRRQAP